LDRLDCQEHRDLVDRMDQLVLLVTRELQVHRVQKGQLVVLVLMANKESRDRLVTPDTLVLLDCRDRPDPLDSLDSRVQGVWMVRLEQGVCQELQDIRELPDHREYRVMSDSKVSKVQPDQKVGPVRLDPSEIAASLEFEGSMDQSVTLVNQDSKDHRVTVVSPGSSVHRVLLDQQDFLVRRVHVDRMVQQAVPVTQALLDLLDQLDPKANAVHRVLLGRQVPLGRRDPEDCRVSVDLEVQRAKLELPACRVRVVQLALLVRQEVRVRLDWLASLELPDFRDGLATLE
jgi:hypothetical protein